MKNTLRNHLKSNFTQIPNDLLEDKSMTSLSRFIYCYMASRPDNWHFYNNYLASVIGCSIATLRKHMDELVTSGWITRETNLRDDNNRFIGNSYELFAKPETTKEKTETPQASEISPSNKNCSAESPYYNFSATDISAHQKNRNGKNVTHSNKDLKQQGDKQKEFLNKKNKQKDLHFDEFWNAYPKKSAPTPCRAKWKKNNLDEIAKIIIADVIARKENDTGWLSGYIHNPMTYINQQIWEGEIITDTVKQIRMHKTDQERDQNTNSISASLQKKYENEDMMNEIEVFGERLT
jgi:hypothetical protein